MKTDTRNQDGLFSLGGTLGNFWGTLGVVGGTFGQLVWGLFFQELISISFPLNGLLQKLLVASDRRRQVPVASLTFRV